VKLNAWQIAAALAGLTVLAGCSDTVLISTPGSAPPTRADAVIEVASDHPTDPHIVDFGEVFAEDVREKQVTIRNVGTDTLQIHDLVLPDVGNFAVLNEDEYSRLLAPDTSTIVILSYSPVRDEHISGSMIVASNDRENSQVSLSLLAEGLAPAVHLDPPSFDFGNRELGCVGQVDVTISNIGRAPLVIDDVFYEDFSSEQELSLVSNLGPGDTLNPNESEVVSIHYVPEDVEFDSGVLHVETNDPSTPDATAQQFGLASYGENQLDQYLQQGNNATDILFVVDNSCSMSEEQSSLAVNFASFLQIIQSLDMDYHLGVVSTDIGDSGQLQGTVPIITPNTPDPEGTFSTNVNLGINGSGIEQAFHNAYLALSSPNVDPGGFNYGFLREEAGLRIVFVSDEQEQSSGVMSWTALDYINWYRAIKPNPDHVVLSDITGGIAGCNANGNNADPATDYVLATNTSAGISASICDPGWISTLQQLAWLSQSFADTFELSRTPVPETVAVSLNGVPVFVGWVYDSALNAVVFDLNHVPENGDALDIEYTVQGDCGD
jgi:hypothetical protein